jgi:hypothetical protein
LFAPGLYDDYMGKPDEKVSWLKKLGVTKLKPPEEETEEETEGGLPGREVKRADTPLDKGAVRGRGKVIFESPIGELDMLSISRADKEGRVFALTIPDSDIAPLLFKAAEDGTPLGTVTISIGGMEITLQDVQISSIQMSGSTVQMKLDSSKPAKISVKRVGQAP